MCPYKASLKTLGANVTSLYFNVTKLLTELSISPVTLTLSCLIIFSLSQWLLYMSVSVA